MYTSIQGFPFPSADQKFVEAVEPLLFENKARTSSTLNLVTYGSLNK